MNEFHGRFFRMNPATETLVFDGTYLRDNMVITVGDSSCRFELTDAMDPYQLDQAEILNCWYRVSHVTCGERYVSFIATYDDGYMRKLAFPIGQPWLVKRNSNVILNSETASLPLVTPEDILRVNTKEPAKHVA